MKALSIGRDQACDIVISDSTDVVSRRHAILNISSSGKISIVDQSRNGTYVNGIRITPNVPVPVSRKDIISFAHVAKLDWSLVPASNAGMRYALIGGVALLLVIGGAVGWQYLPGGNGWGEAVPEQVVDTMKSKSVAKDTAKVVPKENEEQKKDTLSPQAKPDRKGKRESTSRQKSPKEEAPKDTTKNSRPIG